MPSSDQREPRQRAECDDMSALLGDVDVAALVDTQQIRNGLGGGDGAQQGSIARSKDGDIGVRHQPDGLDLQGPQTRFDTSMDANGQWLPSMPPDEDAPVRITRPSEGN